MKEIFITGHKNPDLDSVCSAYAYAKLKNILDPENKYTAVCSGQLSDGVVKQLEIVGVTPPPYKRDVLTKVSDVMLESEEKFEASEPIYNLIKTYNTSKPSVVPLYEKGEFAGLLSVDDITAWFLRDNSGDNPVYTFLADNIASVLPGKLLHKGIEDGFNASIAVGAANLQDYMKFLRINKGSVVVMGARPDHIKEAMNEGVPAIIITARETEDEEIPSVLPKLKISGEDNVKEIDLPEINFDDYKGLVYVTSLDTAEAIRRLRLSQPMGTLMGEQPEAISVTDFFEEAKETLAQSKSRGLAVLDNKKFAGYITRRCFLNRPAYNVILVDHNEAGQSIRGVETANVVEILDHHRLAALKTDLPIYVDARPLGSTCTIVWQHYLSENITPDIDAAKMLLTGIMSDTVILKSPTTTEVDKKAAEALAKICGVDYQEFGTKLFSVTSNLALRDPSEAIMADFKVYEEKGLKIGIGQCETTSLQNFDEYALTYMDAIEDVRAKSGLDWAMIMVTDVLSEKSILINTIHHFGSKLPYEKIDKYNVSTDEGKKGSRAFYMPGVLSRKKQLLPAVIHAVEGN